MDALTLSLSLSERSPLPLIAVEGLTHIIRYVNPAFCRLAGQKSDDLLGKPFAAALPEGEEKGCLALLDNVYRAGESGSLADQEHRHSTSEPRYWSYAAWPILDANERPAGVMIQVTDTTEQVLARRLLGSFNQTLLLSGLYQHELTEVAEAGVQSLQRSMRETDHRVKNNLQIIAALLDMQIMENAEIVAVEELVQLQRCIQTVAALHDLLTDIGKDDPKASLLPATAILKKLLPMWQGIVGTKGLRWSADDVWLPVKKGMSLALLSNELVTNAVKHGGQDVELRLALHENSATLTVSDDGAGFPAGFDPSTSAHFGLEFVESVARLELNGSVAYANTPNGGARVTVTFPLPTSSAPSQAPASVPFASVFAPSLLQETMRSFAAFANLLQDHAVILLDERANILKWSLGAERLLGYSVQEMLGKPLSVLFTPEEVRAGDAARKITQAIQEGCASNERWILRKDGSRFFASGLLTALTDTDVRGFVDILHDVTARRQIEEALRQSEQKYRTLFDSIDEGFCVIEKVEGEVGEPLDFRYLEANPAFAVQSGVSDVVGKTIRQVVPGEPEEWFETYDAILRTGEPIRFERGLVTQGRVLELYAFRVEDETDRRVAVIFKDVTERRRAEEERAAVVREATLLTERNRMAQELHDTLAQGFTGIKLQMDAAEDALPEEPGQAEEYILRAREIAQQSLLEVRRSVQALRPPLLEGGNLVSAFQRLAEQTPGSTKARFVAQGTPFPLPADVEADLYRIGQEALTNALRHAQARQALLELTYTDGQARLHVKDDGQGFDEQSPGGFGLMGMRERAHRLGAELIITSRPGQGTEVSVTVDFPKKERGARPQVIE